MNKNQKSSEIKGIHIYSDSKGRSVYWDMFTKKGYYLPKNKAQDYSRFSMRIPLALIVAIFLMNYMNPMVGIIIGILLYIGSEILFRRSFLNHLSVDKDFDPSTRKNMLEQIEEISSLPRLVTAAIAAVILAALFIIEMRGGRYEAQYIWVYWAVIILLFVIAVMLLYCAVHKKVHSK